LDKQVEQLKNDLKKVTEAKEEQSIFFESIKAEKESLEKIEARLLENKV